MSLALWGGVLVGAMACGLLMVVSRLVSMGRPQLAVRVLPYVRDLPQMSRRPELQVAAPRSAITALLGPWLRSAAEMLERVLGGAASVRRNEALRVIPAGARTSLGPTERSRVCAKRAKAQHVERMHALSALSVRDVAPEPGRRPARASSAAKARLSFSRAGLAPAGLGRWR